jgi:hypothetical protein
VAITRAITIPLNGAEFLELEAGSAAASARSLPQYMKLRCGLAAIVVANRAGAGGPSANPVRQALERRTVTIKITDADFATLDAASIAAGLSIPQYVRTRCGLEVRWASQPKTSSRDHEEDDAWDRLKRLGLDPEQYFPPEQEG